MILNKGYRMPAEWEPQSGVQLTWPHRLTDWAPMLTDITATYEQMAREILRHESLLIVVPEGESLPASLVGSHANAVALHHSPTNDTWARDHGFITLVPTSETDNPCTRKEESLLLDFCFNGWGCKFESTLDNAINRSLYDHGVLRGRYADCLDFVLEGGSIESDGRGTIFTTTQCLMAPNRNQPLSREQIEEELLGRLGARRVVWIDHGSLIGDDTDGHIDTLVRICPDDTLLYMSCRDTADPQYRELQLMEDELQRLHTLDGRPYRLIPLPSPRPIHDEDGQRLPATYANFLVVNGAVLYPTYAQPDLDEQARHAIGLAFPDRELVGIDCRSIIRQHGSLHCCTMQFPAQCPLSFENS